MRFERWDLILDGSTIPVYGKPEHQRGDAGPSVSLRKLKAGLWRLPSSTPSRRRILARWSKAGPRLHWPSATPWSPNAATARRSSEPGSGRPYFGLATALQAQHKAADAQKMEIKGREA